MTWGIIKSISYNLLLVKLNIKMTKKGLIFETLNEVKSMEMNKTNDGFMHLSGVFGVCGVKNNNQRIYEHNNYKKMVESMQERIKKAPIPGELEHPQTMNITTENISHRIDSIKIDENGVVSGEITLLNTPKGKIAQAIVEGGLPLFISSRATGSVDPKTHLVTLENLATYDLVGSPGFSQAELHLNENQCFESICEGMCMISNKDELNEPDNMTNEEVLEKLSLLEGRIDDLEKENTELREQLEAKEDIDVKQLADSIQEWIVEEYSPEVQNWITEHFAEDQKEKLMESMKEYIVETVAPNIQNWIVEEYSPELEKWITEEYSPEVEKWIVEEYSQGIQKWITEEFSPEVEKWITEEYSSEVESKINDKLNESKGNKLESIKETLMMLENLEPKAKPTYRRVDENAPKYIAEMPEDVRVKWNMASDEIKESISRRAKLYNFMTEGAVEKFWRSIDFDSVKPVKNIYEGLENITNERERQIRAMFRSHRR